MLVLPWPPAQLSPNARVHWRVRHRAAKHYRQACAILARAACLSVPDGALELHIEFVPPDRRHRDDDNLIASFKAGRDGIADALGIDDRRFKTTPTISEQVVKGGEVRVSISSKGATA